MAVQTSSASPHTLPRAGRWAVALALTALLLALAAWLGLRWGVPRYLASQDFRERLSAKTAGLVDAPGGFLPLHWREASVTSEGFVARGQPERALQEMRARGLTAQFDWGGLWRRQIVITQLTIDHWQAAFSHQTAAQLEQNIADPAELRPPDKGDSLFHVDLRDVAVRRATMLWGKTADDSGAFRDLALRLWPVGKNLAVYGAGGTFQLGALPQAGVRQFQLRYEKPALDIEWGSLTLGGESEVQVTGRLLFTQPGSMELALGFRQCPVEPFLKPELRAKFGGAFASDTRVRKALGDDQPVTLDGAVRFSGALVKNNPALSKLAAFTHEPRFKELHFETLRGRYSYTEPQLAVEELVGEVPGLFQVEGSVTLHGKQLRGSVQLGVSPKVLESFPGAREEVFTKHRDAYDWTTVKLSGTSDEPENDLKPRLIAAAKKHAVEKVLAPVAKPLEAVRKPVEAVFEKLKELFGGEK